MSNPNPNPTPSPNPDPVRDAIMDSLVPAILDCFGALVYWAKSGFDNWQDEMEYRRRLDVLRSLSPAESKLMEEEAAQEEQRRMETRARVQALYDDKGRPKC